MKKGFTLIELLAVIVILAIIALIAVPIVLDIINETKHSAIMRSSELYVKAVENAIAHKLLIDPSFKLEDGTYSIMKDGNICLGILEEDKCNGEILKVEVKGEKPVSGEITITNGEINKVIINISDKEIIMNSNGEFDYYLAPGLYDKNNNLIASWDELVEKHDIKTAIEDYYLDVESVMLTILENYNKASKLVIDESVTKIGEAAFNDCTSLTEVIIPNSVTSISSSAFSGCTGLTSITIPDSVTSIGESAFKGCTGLTSITIPNSVTFIAGDAFEDCSGLSAIKVDENNTVYDSRDNSNAIIKTSTNELVVGCKNTIIPDSVTSIGSYAFQGCTRLTSITIPSSVTSIGDSAFSGCTSLSTIKVDENNTVYDSRDNSNAIIKTSTNELVVGCKNTIIPDSVTRIGSYAFEGSGLISIIIPSSVTSIGGNAFSWCPNLTSIKVDENNPVYDSRDNSNAIIKTSTNELVVGCKNTVIPDSVTSIGHSAFRGCPNLTSITIPSSVTSIGAWAFHGCSGLTSITIPSSVTSISSGAFSGCKNLTKIYYKGTATGSPWYAPNAEVITDF